MGLIARLFRREPSPEQLDLVSRLVKDSFGAGFKPNYDIAPTLSPDQQGHFQIFVETARLKLILRPIHSEKRWEYTHAGGFYRQDGSELMVSQKFVHAGYVYARHYEQETGKEVNLTVWNDDRGYFSVAL